MAIDFLAIYTFGIIRTHSFQGSLGSSLLFGPGGQLLRNDLRIAGLWEPRGRRLWLNSHVGLIPQTWQYLNMDKILSFSFSVTCVQKEPVSPTLVIMQSNQLETQSWVFDLGAPAGGLALCSLPVTLERWFSAFPMLQPFNTVPHIGVTPPSIQSFCCYFIAGILLLLLIVI